MSENPMHKAHAAPSCGAHARTTGQQCKAPAIKGKNRCRMHGGKSPGRPRTRDAYRAYLEQKREWRRKLRELNAAIKNLKELGQ
jgi:hypothetical protein